MVIIYSPNTYLVKMLNINNHLFSLNINIELIKLSELCKFMYELQHGLANSQEAKIFIYKYIFD